MRTTLTLDADVARLLEAIRKARNERLRRVVNEALRLGLQQMAATPKRKKAYHQKGVDLGRCRIGSLDNIADVLAVAEDETFR